MLGRAADEGSGQAIAGIVRLCDGVFETAHTDDLQQRTEEFAIGTFRHISHVNDRGRANRAALYGADHGIERGRASCREGGCEYGENTEVAVSYIIAANESD